MSKRKILINILLNLITAAVIYGMIVGAVLLSMAFGQGPEFPSSPKQEQKPVPTGQCPKTKVVGPAEDCFKCHVPVTFRLREPDPCDGIRLPRAPVRARCVEGKVDSLTWYLSVISSDQAEEVFTWIADRGLKKLTIEIQSPGGSLFEAWRIAGMMRAAQAQGVVIETRCHGFAASAGFLILANGSHGHRYAVPTAHLMWHELMSLSLFRIDTPSTSEETSKTLRKLQDIANSRLAQVSCMRKEEIDQMVKNKDFWMTGEEALQKCFVDHLIDQ